MSSRSTFSNRLALLAMAGGLSGVLWAASRPAGTSTPAPPTPPPDSTLLATAQALDEKLGTANSADGIDDLTFARRLALGTVGVIPSLEEIRWYESIEPADRRERYLERLLADRRFGDAVSERLASSWLPIELGDNFVLYRRQRFIAWLADEVRVGRPYDAIVREMISATGRGTDTPAVNFVTSYEYDPETLAGRTARDFLSLDLDCAQCHDHPFAPWKQKQFRGLAAHFSRVSLSRRGVGDDREQPYRFDADAGRLGVLVEPAYPYAVEHEPAGDSYRERLADWVTDTANDRFAESIANRVWEMMFGRPIVEPVDNLEGKCSAVGVLPILAEDFRQHDHDLRRLFRVIALTSAFSAPPALAGTAAMDAAPWSRFPDGRLTPRQIARSLVQLSSLNTVDGETGVLRRVPAFFEQQDFIKMFQSGSDDVAGTVGQRLMLMNDEIVAARIRAELFTASGRLAMIAPTDERAVELSFLTCLTRRPTPEESTYFVDWLKEAKGDERGRAIEDLQWTLINGTEFLWSH